MENRVLLLSENIKVARAIIFDVYGTLFDLKSFAAECDKIIQRRGSQLLEAVEQKQLEYVLTRLLVGRYADYASITRGAIRFALRKMGNAPDEKVIDDLFSAFLHLEPFDDVEAALNDMDELDARILLLSNGTQGMLDKLVEHAGLSLLSEEVASVEGARTYKPDPRAYQHGLNHLQIHEKERVLYVSGNTWDVAGAKAFGLRVGWVNRTGQPAFDQELLDLRPDYEFSDLRQIKKFLVARESDEPELP